MKQDNLEKRCLQCRLPFNPRTTPHVVIYDKDTNEEGHLHKGCVRYYEHNRAFRVLEEHAH